jgi:hypothetical protein
LGDVRAHRLMNLLRRQLERPRTGASERGSDIHLSGAAVTSLEATAGHATHAVVTRADTAKTDQCTFLTSLTWFAAPGTCRYRYRSAEWVVVIRPMLCKAGSKQMAMPVDSLDVSSGSAFCARP